MPRLIKKTVILAKLETVFGTDAVPTGAANAIQVFDLSITPLDIKTVDINTVTPWFGAAQKLSSTASVKVSFSVLLAGAGLAHPITHIFCRLALRASPCAKFA